MMKRLESERSTGDLITDLSKYIPGYMDKARVPGLSLSIIRDGKVFWRGVFGVRNQETGDPVTRETVFEAASLSKPVFAYGALKLCEDGLLELDKPLAEYMTEPYETDDVRLEQVTLRQVLSHTTGLPNWRPIGGGLKLHFQPGERFSYSGEGYMYLQAVVSALTGRAPAEWIWDKVLKPLGMLNSRFTWTGEGRLAAATGHDEIGKPKEKGEWGEMWAAASLHTTPTDYGKFMGAVMRPASEHADLLGPEISKLMLTPQVQVNDSAPWQKGWPKTDYEVNALVSWGLGWGLQRTPLGDSIWHWGDNGTFRAFAIGLPGPGQAVVIMNNGLRGQEVIKQIFHELIGGEFPGMLWLDQVTSG